MFGHTKVRGYHPLVAAVSGTGDVVHSRLRGGNANSGRGAASFLTESFNRVRAAGATGPLTLRADSGFYNHKVVDACRAADVRYSITAKLYEALKKVIEAIDESAWTPIAYFLEGADVAETTYQPFGKKGRAHSTHRPPSAADTGQCSGLQLIEALRVARVAGFGLELIGDEPVPEAWVIVVGVEGVVEQVGVGEVPIADWFGSPLEIALPGESEHPTGHGDGDTLVSQIRHQRVDHFGLRPRPR